LAQGSANAKTIDMNAVEDSNPDDAFLSTVNVPGYFDFGDSDHGMALGCAGNGNLPTGFLFDHPSQYRTMISTGI